MKRRILGSVIIWLILFIFAQGKLYAFSGEGEGTLPSPYLIYTAEQLAEMKDDIQACYRLEKDIDLEGNTWTPIGDQNAPFTGMFDGNGHMIENIMIYRSLNYIGFFGKLEGAAVKNLEIRNITVVGLNYTGGLAGATVDSAIINCSITGESWITGNSFIGGLIGSREEGLFLKNASSATVEGARGNVGGVIGLNTGDVEQSYAEGKIWGAGSIGGLIGVSNNGMIVESFATGDVEATGANSTGGFIGQILGGSIENCFATGAVKSTHSYVGGLAGNVVGGNIYSCYSLGAVSGAGRLGGLVGSTTGLVENSYFNSQTTGLTEPAEQARTSIQLKSQDNYGSWNLSDIWELDGDSGYPILQKLKESIKIYDDIIYIRTGEQLRKVKNNLYGAYKLENDIDLENQEFGLIGKMNTAFKGTFDGAGHTISNLTMRQGIAHTGLFGVVDGGEIINVHIHNLQITGGNNTGGLVGTFKSGLISNCSITGEGGITGVTNTGGLVGAMEDGRVEKSMATIMVNSTGINTGGLVGQQLAGVLENSFSLGNVAAAGNYSGGLVGSASGLIRHSYSMGAVQGTENKGGLIGQGAVSVEESFFNKESSGISQPSTQAKSIEEMKQPATYTGWDMSEIWIIENEWEYPYLQGLTNPFPKMIKTPEELSYRDLTHEEVMIMWTEISEALGYQILINNEITIDMETAYHLVEELESDTVYTFQVRAVDLLYKSPWSRTLEIKTKKVPLVPINSLIVGKVLQNEIELSWEVLPGANEYELLVNDELIVGILEEYYLLDGLMPNTTYTITIRGVNEYETGPDSEPLSVLTLLKTVGNVEITEITSDSMVLHWEMIEGATYYEIEYGENLMKQSTGANYTLAGLQANTRYTVRVRAKTEVNKGLYSEAVYGLTKLPAVEGLVVTEATPTSIAVKWEPVTGASRYEVDYGSGISWETVSLTAMLTDLTPETAYQIKVRAKSTGNEGAWSGLLTVVTPKSGSDYRFKIVNGGEYTVVFRVDEIQSFNNKTFTVTYDTEKLTVMDLAAQTPILDLATGLIPGTNIEIMTHYNGVVTFKVNQEVPAGETWSGVVTAVKFKAKANGEAVILLE